MVRPGRRQRLRLLAAGAGQRAARREAAARRHGVERRHPAGDRGQVLPVEVHARNRREQRRACRGARGRAKIACTGACSTIWPAYITATRSAICATTPRLWVMNSIAMPCRSLQVGEQPQHLRLDGHVQRRGRLVGEQQRRLAGQRDGDHHPLAHAAGELVRIVVKAPRGGGDLHLLQHRQRPPVGLRPGQRRDAGAAPRPPARRWSSPGSGWSSAPGRSSPCGRRAASPAPAPAGRRCRALPAGSARRRSARPGRGSSPMMDSAVIDLPQPDSPTSASVSPRRSESEIAVHRRAPGAADAELGAQALEVQNQGVRMRHCLSAWPSGDKGASKPARGTQSARGAVVTARFRRSCMAPRVEPVRSDAVPPARTDVVVVGGGIIGASTALFLRAKGRPCPALRKGRHRRRAIRAATGAGRA